MDPVSLIFPKITNVTISKVEEEESSGLGKALDVLGISGPAEISKDTITLDVTTNEGYNHQASITDLTVGSLTLNDHKTILPSIFTITGIVSNTPVIQGPFGGIASTVSGIINKFTSDQTREQQAYDSLVSLWKSNDKVSMTTGLTSVKDCLVESVNIARTPNDSGSLPITVTLKQVKFSNQLEATSSLSPDGMDDTKNGGSKKL